MEKNALRRGGSVESDLLALEQLLDEKTRPSERLRILAGNEVEILVPESEKARRLAPDDGNALAHVRRQHFDIAGGETPRLVEHPLRDLRPAATYLFRENHFVPRGLQEHRRRLSDLGLVVVHEGVVKENDSLPLRPRHPPTPPEPACERLARKGRQAPSPIDARDGFENAPGPVLAEEPVREGASENTEPAGPFGMGEEALAERRRMLLVVEGEKFRLQTRHVHVRRTLRFAALAGDAEIR